MYFCLHENGSEKWISGVWFVNPQLLISEYQQAPLKNMNGRYGEYIKFLTDTIVSVYHYNDVNIDKINTPIKIRNEITSHEYKLLWMKNKPNMTADAWEGLLNITHSDHCNYLSRTHIITGLNNKLASTEDDFEGIEKTTQLVFREITYNGVLLSECSDLEFGLILKRVHEGLCNSDSPILSWYWKTTPQITLKKLHRNSKSGRSKFKSNVTLILKDNRFKSVFNWA